MYIAIKHLDGEATLAHPSRGRNRLPIVFRYCGKRVAFDLHAQALPVGLNAHLSFYWRWSFLTGAMVLL